MKYLNDYISSAQTELFESVGAFFAFGNQQFDEQAIKAVRYASLGSGLICPTANVDALTEGLDSITSRGIAADIAENGIKAIIHRELANHECQITMDISDAVSRLADYPGIDREAIQAEWPEYFQMCIDNDYF